MEYTKPRGVWMRNIRMLDGDDLPVGEWFEVTPERSIVPYPIDHEDTPTAEDGTNP